MARRAVRNIKVQVRTKYGSFAVALERDEAGYSVRVPALPEVATCGATLVRAKAMAKEAIEVAIEGEILLQARERGVIRFVRMAAHAA